MNLKILKLYKQLCQMNQTQVRHFVASFLRQQKYVVVETASYIYAEGDIPVALVAHSDTVFKTAPVNFFYDEEKNVMWSPEGMGADDKAGVTMIIALLKKYRLRPHIIITADEEIGCVGANKLISQVPACPFKECKYLIQLDRRGKDDCVFYDLNSPAFEDYIESFGFKSQWGSYSDISTIAPAWGIAATNLSVGYVNEHSYIEMLYWDDWNNTLDKLVNMLKDAPNTAVWDYIEYEYHGYHYGMGWDIDESCDMCGKQVPYTDLLPVYTQDNPYYGKDVCPTCFSKICLQMSWCKKCNKGWYGYGAKGNNWLCPQCQEGEKDAILNPETPRVPYKF